MDVDHGASLPTGSPSASRGWPAPASISVLVQEARFSDRDKAAIDARLTAYPCWSVAYTVENGIEYARLSARAVTQAPVLTLARQDGLTGFAALWSDGSQMGAALNASLSCALSLIVQVIEDAWCCAGMGTDEVLALDGA